MSNLFPLLAASFAVTACSFSPLERKVDVGEEPFVVFVAEGSDGRTDLFASLPGGGEVSRFTFTSLDEYLPRLTADGGLISFLRQRSSSEPDQRDVVIMNLVSGAERSLPLPDGASVPTRVSWNHDESGLYVETEEGRRWLIKAPPAEPEPREVAGDGVAASDSAFWVILGTPAFARAESCMTGGGVCVVGKSGEEQLLSNNGTDPFRWGTDSVAWFEGSTLHVRSLGPGSPRQVSWPDGRVTGMRQGSYATASRKKRSSPAAGSSLPSP